MNNWQKVKLKDVVSILGDGLHGTPTYDDSGEYFFINGNNLFSGKIKIKADTKRINANEYLKYKKELNDRTLLVSINGTIGNVATYRGEKCILGKSACYFNILPEVCKGYIYYILLHDDFQNYAKNWAAGTTIKNVSLKQMREYEFLLPSFEKQQQIVQILSSLDDKIELNAQINHNLEEQAKAIFKSWFVDFEPFQDGTFVDSELGQIPAGWRTGVLSEIADITMGQSPKGSSYNENSEGSVFYQGRAEFTDRFPTRRLFTTEPKRMVEAGDVLLSVRAPVGDMNIANESCCIGRGLAAIHAKKDFSSFVFYTMQALKPELDKYNGEGTVFGCVNKDALNTQKVIIPPDNIISDFEKIASSLDQAYLVGFEENMRLAQLRDALLPKLMSGEIDVSEVEI